MRHFVIPDTQVKMGVPLEHLRAAGNYIVDKQPETIVHLGDHWDMPSLSYYDVGTLKAEGGRYVDDIQAGQQGMEMLLAPIWEHNAKRARNKMKQYKPRMIFLHGNHEHRITRSIESDPKIQGERKITDLGVEKFGWKPYEFLRPVEVDGVLYCHYFVNTASLKKSVIGGTIENKLKHIGQTFTMGHQQTLQMGVRYLNNGKAQRGLVAGAFYQHDEEYMGHQGNHHYRGCIMKHEVKDGNYCLMELSLDYLMKEWL